MSELAFNVNGEPFEVPATATGWRVRKLKQKGAPEVVYGREGLPLVLPIDAELDDLRREVSAPGRYRMDPVDDNHRPVPMAPAGYVYIHAAEQVSEPEVKLPLRLTDGVVVEAMRMNAELARSVVDRFPQMMEAAAILLRAADGAGLPARQGLQIEAPASDSTDSDNPTDDEETRFDLNGLIAQIVPLVISALATKKMPKLESLLDWRKVSPKPLSTQAQTNPANKEALPPIEPAMMAHFVAVQSALTVEEASLAREMAAELPSSQLRTWFEELSRLSVPDAVAKVRAFLGTSTGDRA